MRIASNALGIVAMLLGVTVGAVFVMPLAVGVAVWRRATWKP